MKLSKIASMFLAGGLIIGLATGCHDDNGGSNGSVTGTVSDAYVAGAKVCIDNNANKKCDAKDPYVLTDNNGYFSFSSSEFNSSAKLIATGGTDIGTGDVVTDTFVLPANAKAYNVTPLTTIVAKSIDIAKAKGTTLDVKTATKRVAKAFGLKDPNDVYADPVKTPDTAKAVLKVHVVKKLARKNFDAIAEKIATKKEVNLSKDFNVDASYFTAIDQANINDPVAAEQAIIAVAEANVTDINASTLEQIIKKVKKINEESKGEIDKKTVIATLASAIKKGENIKDLNATEIVENAKPIKVKDVMLGNVKVEINGPVFKPVEVKVNGNTTWALYKNIKIDVDKDSIKNRTIIPAKNATVKITVENKETGKKLTAVISGIKVSIDSGVAVSYTHLTLPTIA
jgi:hypothetical protein